MYVYVCECTFAFVLFSIDFYFYFFVIGRFSFSICKLILTSHFNLLSKYSLGNELGTIKYTIVCCCSLCYLSMYVYMYMYVCSVYVTIRRYIYEFVHANAGHSIPTLPERCISNPRLIRCHKNWLCHFWMAWKHVVGIDDTNLRLSIS